VEVVLPCTLEASCGQGKSPDVSSVNYLFVEVSFHGQRVLVGPIYNPPGVDGAPI
jgi:hypothetical protein